MKAIPVLAVSRNGLASVNGALQGYIIVLLH